MTSPAITADDIQYVRELAREAGVLAAKMRDGVSVTEKSGPHDRVTGADIELSRIIIQQLGNRFQDDLIISEEGHHPQACPAYGRIWLIDPIDGTDNYIRNDGQYAVMIGLLVDLMPVFGWVYAPASDRSYFGGPVDGAWEQQGANPPRRLGPVDPLSMSGHRRLMIGFRDRKRHPWVDGLPGVTWVKSGSVGLKVGKVLENEADMFIHLSGKLKVWDTAAPVAIALGAGLEVGRLDCDQLSFPLPAIEHQCSVVIGRPGSLAWSRANLSQVDN